MSWPHGEENVHRAPKRFTPTRTFGPCPRCGKERTCVHHCVPPAVAAAIQRGLFERRVEI
jgi:hypothetical protein